MKIPATTVPVPIARRSWPTAAIVLVSMAIAVPGASAQITAAMQQIIDRAHAKGVSIIGGTLFPLARPDKAGWAGAKAGRICPR